MTMQEVRLLADTLNLHLFVLEGAFSNRKIEKIDHQSGDPITIDFKNYVRPEYLFNEKDLEDNEFINTYLKVCFPHVSPDKNDMDNLKASAYALNKFINDLKRINIMDLYNQNLDNAYKDWPYVSAKSVIKLLQALYKYPDLHKRIKHEKLRGYKE